MAVTQVVSKLNTTSKIRLGQHAACYGTITFGGADTYVAGGFDVRNLIKRVFGVGDVESVCFFNGMSDAGITTGEATAKYDAVTGLVKLFVIGRTSGAPGSPQASDVELGGVSINAGRLDFVAYTTGEGTTSPAGDYI
jgi:hypothetical protein